MNEVPKMADGLSKLMNFVVFAVLGLGGLYLFTSPKLPVEPPNDAFFQSEVVNKPGLVLVKFGAEWCPPCRAMESELDQLQAQLHGQGSVVRVDVDQHPQLAEHYGVSSIPRLLLFRNGQVVGDRLGFNDHQQLLSWMNEPH